MNTDLEQRDKDGFEGEYNCMNNVCFCMITVQSYLQQMFMGAYYVPGTV